VVDMAIPDISLVEKRYDSRNLRDISDEFGDEHVQPLVMGSQRTRRWRICHYMYGRATVLFRHAMHFLFFAPTPLSSL
jgi:hypothetical protein